MSNHKYTTAACLVITVLTLAITILFMMGPKIGLQPVTTDKSADEAGTFSDRDLDGTWDESSAVSISLDDKRDSEVQSGGAYFLDGDLYIRSAGTYVLSGSMTDHQIIVQAKGEKVQLVLDGVTIVNTDHPPIYIDKADKVFLTLAEGSENKVVLSDTLAATAFSEEPDAAIYSSSDLSVNGSGVLYVQSAEYHGIKSTDDLVISSGTLNVEAGQNAVHGRDSVRICGGIFNLTAGNDGIKANHDSNSKKGYVLIKDGEFYITAAHDGIQAVTDLTIEGGAFEVTAGDRSTVSRNAGDVPPDGMNAPGTGEMPEGGAPDHAGMPDGGEMPGRGEFPGGEAPDKREMPEGGAPDYAEAPEGGEMPQGGTPDHAEAPERREPNRGKFLNDNETAKIDGGSEIEDHEEDESKSYKGLKAGNAVTITGGSFTLDTQDDGIHSDSSVLIQNGTFTIASGDDGIHGDDCVTIEEGTVMITASYEGVEGKKITVSGGVVDVTASDDGFNASDGSASFDFMNMESSSELELPVLHITGGTIQINADGDGLDSNGDLIIDGGTIYIDGPVNGGNGALDSGTESGGTLVIHGGTVLALGSSGMEETFADNSTQCSFLYNLPDTFTEGEELKITDSQGRIICSYTIAKSGNSIVFSDPQLIQKETYTVTVGEQSAEITLDSISTGSFARGFGSRGEAGK